MDYSAQISAALADLNTQSNPNYILPAKKYKIVRTTLALQYNGKTTSRKAATCEYGTTSDLL
jgi:hypothetical protein